jgi:hypothetical protein
MNKEKTIPHHGGILAFLMEDTVISNDGSF